MRKDDYTALCSVNNLYDAWLRVERNKGGPGIDGESIEDFRKDYERHLRCMARQLQAEAYEPSPLRCLAIPKEGGGDFRVLGIPTVRDRIVYQAANSCLQYLWDPHFSPFSFAYRPGRKVGDAIKTIRKFIMAGRTWFIKGDIRGCFDSLDWDLLSTMLKTALPDQRFRRLVNQAIRIPTVYRGRFYERFCGVPQGSPLSPILANLYLHQFDAEMFDYSHSVIRYGDDWLVLVGDRSEAERGFYTAAEILDDLRIEISEGKSGIGDLAKETISFLGYRINSHELAPSRKAWDSVCNAIGQLKRRGDSEGYRAARAKLLHVRSQYEQSGVIRQMDGKSW